MMVRPKKKARHIIILGGSGASVDEASLLLPLVAFPGVSGGTTASSLSVPLPPLKPRNQSRGRYRFTPTPRMTNSSSTAIVPTSANSRR